MNLLSIFQQRHSIRKYTGAPIDDAALTQIIQSGLLSASSRSIRPWEFIVVKDKDMLRHLSECRTGAAWMLAGADAAIVVIANAEVSDVWIEDRQLHRHGKYASDGRQSWYRKLLDPGTVKNCNFRRFRYCIYYNRRLCA